MAVALVFPSVSTATAEANPTIYRSRDHSGRQPKNCKVAGIRTAVLLVG